MILTSSNIKYSTFWYIFGKFVQLPGVKIKGVVPYLKAIFSYFQNINFLKVQSISDHNLFTELKNNKIKYFCQILENYLQCRFLHFSYIKKHTEIGKKVYKIQGNSLFKAIIRLFSPYFVQ